MEFTRNKEKQVVHCLCGRREQTFKQSKARRILAECPLLTCGSTKCEALLPIRPEGFIDIVSLTHNFWSHFYKQPDAEESAALQRTRNIRDRGIRILQNQEQARATPPFAEGSRDEVIRLVRANQIAVVWVTSKGAIVHIPTQPLSLLAGEDASFFDRQALTDGPFFEDLEGTDTPQMIVTGVKGLSAVDPEWDGKDLFTCSNPECKQIHNSDWNTHDNLWKRAQFFTRAGVVNA